jgi:hypothetical protein
VVDASLPAGVSTEAQVQALAVAANAVMTGAAGGTAPTLAQLQLLGITGVNADNLVVVQQGIASSGSTGSGVNTQTLLQAVVTASVNTPLISLGTGVSDGATSSEATQTSGVIEVTAASGSSISVTFTDSLGHTVVKTLTGSGAAQALALGAADLDLGVGTSKLVDGAIAVRVVATDSLGHLSNPGTTSFNLDTVAPTTTVSTTAFSADTGTSTTDFITKTPAQTITGTLSAVTVSGEVIQVSLDNGTTWSTATNTIGSNTYSYAATLISSNTLQVRVSDTAGNVSAALTQAYVLDTTAPTLTVSTVSLSADTGTSSTDVNTKTAAQTISATLSAALSTGDILSGSVDGGTHWTDITNKVSGTAITWTSATLSGTSSIVFKVTDLAGNDGSNTGSTAYVLDTTAPTVTITPSLLSLNNNATETVTFTFSEAVTGFDLTDISASNGSFSALTQVGSSNTYTATFTASTIGSSVFGVTASSYTDLAGNLGAAGASQSVAVTTPSSISLGSSYGNLIAPITEQGGTYYYWDRSGDGTLAGSSSGGLDYVAMTTLIPLFSHDFNNAAGSVIDETYHYAWINGVHLSLPTLGAAYPGNGILMPGTAANTTYSGLLGIWDSQNASGTTNDGIGTDGTVSYGVPSGWPNMIFWSATPTATGEHAAMYLSNGQVYTTTTTNWAYVALQVL